jgi:copper homeostasis protein
MARLIRTSFTCQRTGFANRPIRSSTISSTHHERSSLRERRWFEALEVRLSREIVFEVCAENLESCLAAREGGADRIELCSALIEDGLTPSHGLMRAAVEQSGLPIYTMLRPRGGDFVYSDAELAIMLEDLEHARSLGVSGFVAGVLQTDGAVDVDRMRRLVEQAAPLEMTFHRAFDVAADLEDALEDVIATGCRRLLTSGGAADVYSGAERLRYLIERADGRIAIAVGGGLRRDTAAEVARITGASQFHGSVRHLELPPATTPQHRVAGRMVTRAGDVRMMIAALEIGHAGNGRAS